MLPNVSIRLFSVPRFLSHPWELYLVYFLSCCEGTLHSVGKVLAQLACSSKWRWNLIAKIPSQGHSFVIQEICGFERRSWKGCLMGLHSPYPVSTTPSALHLPVSWMREKTTETQQHNSATHCGDTAETETLCWWENTRACVAGESQRMVWHQCSMGWVCWMNYFPLRACLLYLESCPCPCSSQERALLF